MSDVSFYRITLAKYADSAFQGIGGLKASARWHTAGRRVVYAADSPALAMLELLGNLQDAALLRARFVLIEAKVPEAVIGHVKEADLPVDWNHTDHPAITRQIGDAWLRQQNTAVLRVPSIHLPLGLGWNILLNPSHQALARIRIGKPIALSFHDKLLPKESRPPDHL